MRCLVLGGTGFIGKILIEKLERHGHFVRTYSLSREFSGSRTVEHIQGDFSIGENLAIALEDIDVVYHLICSSLPSLPHSKSSEDIEINLLGTIKLLNLMCKAKNKKIIFASSGGTIYGVPKYLPLDELHSTDPICSYGITKLTIEKYLRIFSLNSEIASVALRISNPYGPHHNIKNKQGLINTLCYNIKNNQPLTIWGDGSVVRDYIFIDDLGDALLCALNETGKFLVANISSGIGLSVNAIIQKVLSISDSNPDIQYHAARTFDIQECFLSNNRAKKILKWSPKIEIDEGIKKTFDWLGSETHLNL